MRCWAAVVQTLRPLSRLSSQTGLLVSGAIPLSGFGAQGAQGSCLLFHGHSEGCWGLNWASAAQRAPPPTEGATSRVPDAWTKVSGAQCGHVYGLHGS